MKNPLLFVIAAILVVGFALYMTTYTVRFTDSAIVATFGNVNESSGVINAEGGQEGLKFRLPTPIQTVTVYDKRPRFFQTELETYQTADEGQVVAQAFIAWRVSDPLRFYRQFNQGGSDARLHYSRAEDAIRPVLRSAMSQVSRYALNELFSPGAGASRLPELEADILSALSEPGSNDDAGTERLTDYGIEIAQLGINRLVPPQDTTQQIFEAMKEERNRIAEETNASGQALADAIRSEAEEDAKTIRTFTELAAEELRTLGVREATPYVAQLNENPELAQFLEIVDFVSESFGKTLTLILPADEGALYPFSTEGMRGFIDTLSDSGTGAQAGDGALARGAGHTTSTTDKSTEATQ
ncbi:MAG: SPFH domain-containing protein [Planctomycetota bacterium]